MKPDPKIRAMARPVRVGYLLEDGPDAHGWLDAIFADCFGRDGGRQSLIVPVAGGAVSKRYQDWLRIFDPDIVIALTFDNDALVPDLVELLADTTILQGKRKRDEPDKHPRVGIPDVGLAALSWLPFMKARSSVIQTAPEFILDRYPAWEDDGFVKDNFGTLCGSLDPFPMHEQIAIRGLVLTPKDSPENRWRIRLVNAEETTDGYEAIERMAQRSSIATLAQLSNLCCQPHRTEHPWKEGFCLVIGDSFTDRVSCWNAGLLFDDAQVQSYKTLRVPAAIRSDEGRTVKIASFLRRWNWIGQHNGPARVVVRSNSLSAAEVQEFVIRLQKAAMSNVGFSSIASTDDCCPSDVKHIYHTYQIGNLGPATSETAIRDATTIVSVPKPVQLSYSGGMHPIFSRGYWFADLGIDRLQDNSRFDNARDTWRLPIRAQLVRMFHDKSAARILRNREISVRVNVDIPAIEVKQPEDRDVFHRILCERVQYPHADLRASTAKPIAYKSSAISDKGRYLQGMIGMFGSLNYVEHVLSKHFWRNQFKNMAAPAQDQHQEVITFLQRRMKAKNGVLSINDDAGWKHLAERVIQISSRLRVPRETTRYEKLLNAWELELKAAIDADEQLKDRRDQILLEASDELKRALSFLFECGVFYRGHEWSCRHCSHRNWVGVEALKEIVPCEVCRQEHQLPVDVALDLRLNEFFATCLREHDTMTVAWALCALREESHGCFIFAPQTALFRDYPEKQGGKVDRELDVVCIVDGRLVIGEAKARVDLIGQGDIEDLARAAMELEADVAILAALSGERGLMDQKVQRLRPLLPRTVEVRGLVSDWNDQPSCYL